MAFYTKQKDSGTVKVSDTDTEAGFLIDKILAGTNITIDHDNIGGNETITINSSGGGGGGGSLVVQTVSGTINGSNVTFTIPSAISSGKSFIDLNGQVYIQDTDYTISGTTVTYSVAPAADLSGLTHKIVYAGGTASEWVFDATPTGTVNGVNTVFTLPVTVTQVMVFADGALVKGAGTDYTLSGATITFTAGRQPFSSIAVNYLP